jgi:hypothetical protein
MLDRVRLRSTRKTSEQSRHQVVIDIERRAHAINMADRSGDLNNPLLGSVSPGAK